MLGRLLSILCAAALPLGWLAVHYGGELHDPPLLALCSGIAIFGAAFLLSWASEVAELDVPRALALALLALIAVLPEYAVDVYFAWRAGKDPTYTAYATANMTGANRLLLGVGWAVPVLAAWVRFRQTVIELPREEAVEVGYLALATLYSFVIPLKGTLSVIDTLVLFAIFGAYVRAALRSHHVEREIAGVPELLVQLGPVGRRLAALSFALLAGTAILTAAEPFAESLITTGKRWGVEEFLLVQWLAPLASESPEFIVALLFALKGAAAAGICMMVSSKVNQWTLLVGALPLAFMISSGGDWSMHLDMRQREEIFLTSAQSLFGLVIIANFRFTAFEALALFVLFVAQLLFTSATARWFYAALYIVLALSMVAANADTRRAAADLLPWRAARRGG
jgi:cation:H+ antiporter